MINELRIQGVMGLVDYYTYIAGKDVSKTIFYEDTPSFVRFFSRGNEFIIDGEGVRYRGLGGSFCEYMFGVDKPMDDTVRRDVVNRLIMFGAYMGKDDNVIFTDNIEGTETFYKLYLQGHAVRNFFFLVSSDIKGSNKERQKEILMAVGKYLKRTPLISFEDSTELMRGFQEALRDESATVFLFKLVHRSNNEFYSVFRDFYFSDRTLSSGKQKFLDEIIEKNKIDEYQIERLKIDIMYRHPENKTIVDEYRDILVEAVDNDTFQAPETARLRRLRTLAIRNNIPGVLFDTLDSRLLKDKKIPEEREPDYLKEARGILETLFFKDPNLKKHIIKEDIVRLLKAKHMAHEKSDMGFEQIVLDAGKLCDETVRETDNLALFEELSGIITFFDRYDNISSLLNSIAFTEKAEVSEDILRSLIGNKKEFEQLQKGFFENLFIRQFMTNKYLTPFGKKRVETVFNGLNRIINNDASVKDVLRELKNIAEEERIYKITMKWLKERIKEIYPRLEVKTGREEVLRDLETELSFKGILKKVPAGVFEKAVIDIKKEAFYINHVFPKVIKSKDLKTREDFLQNSGLDRFYIETLEKEHLKNKGIPYSALEEIIAGNGAH